jgi:hypothetical protein
MYDKPFGNKMCGDVLEEIREHFDSHCYQEEMKYWEEVRKKIKAIKRL